MKNNSEQQLLNIFESQYKALNTKQKEAVDSIDGPVMVIAGPGTGKTTILTLRIANILLKTDTPASGILAITFTEAGVRAIKKKLLNIIGDRADEIKVHTFHSFASSIITEFQDHFVHLDNIRQMTDIDQEALIREILKDKKYSDLRPLGKPDFYIYPILNLIRDSKKENKNPEDLENFATFEIERIKNDEDSISTRGKSAGELKADAKKRIEKCQKTILASCIYKEYEERKRNEGQIDFDDLIFELLQALKRDELLRQLLQEKFLYIHVDEHQDTNDSQNEIIKILADFFENPNVFIVGDEKQAIYRFQGASVKNFLKFEGIWKDIKTISLTDNYRSHQGILDASFPMIEKNYAEGEHLRLRIPLIAKNGSKIKPIELVEAPNQDTGDSFLIKEVQRIRDEESDSTVVLMAKTNKEVDRIIGLLEENRIDFSAERSIDIFNHPIGSVFFTLIEFLKDFSKTDLLAKTIAYGLFELSFEDEINALKALKSENLMMIESLIPILSKIRKNILTDNPIQFIHNLAEDSGLLKLVTREPAFVEVWRAVVSLSEQLIKQKQIGDTQTLIDSLLSYKASAENKSVKVTIGSNEGNIKVMTAHGSKGLEFDYVFIPNATEESWRGRRYSEYFVSPTAPLMEEGDENQDARRLFYVALTRAKKHIILITPIIDAAGITQTPLNFISELDQKMISKNSLQATKNKEILNKGVHTNNKKQKIIDLAKRILTEQGLSVTALNHFMKCPSEFIYKSILRVPEAPNPNSEAGNAMHKAFKRIWISNNKSKENIEKVIKETVNDYIGSSLILSFEKKTVIDKLMKNVQHVAQSLEGHFNTSGKSFPETSKEKTITTNEANIIIKGNMDVVIDTGIKFLIFDYKTKEKMSQNEIKGETKNSDGNYFRQLVYYKMLTEDKNNNKEIVTSLVFLTPDQKGNCHVETMPVEKSDIDRVVEEIKILTKSVWSGNIMSETCTDTKCEFCRWKKIL